MLLIGKREVEDLLDLDALIDALAPAMVDLSEGRASVPPRGFAHAPDGLLGAMPGYTPSAGVLAAKLVTVFPANTALPTHQAVVVVFDPATGEPAALLDGTSITAIRTGAGSALATRVLARENATTLAILGTGVQARSHINAVKRVRDFMEIRIAGRDRSKTEALAEDLGAEAAESWQAACDGADVVCACTHPHEPVVRREWLEPGAHVNSVGYNPPSREVDEATVAAALVVVESITAAQESVDLEGAEDLTEVGEIIAGSKPGRTDLDQITLYKSVGVAVQDAVAAALVLKAAQKQGIGREVAL
jgi:alanine dehydrogenase